MLDDVPRLVRRAATAWCALGAVGAAALLQATPLLFFQARQRAPLVGIWISPQAVGLATFVILGQVFGDGKTFLVAEQ